MRSAKKWDVEKTGVAKNCWEEDHSFDWNLKRFKDRESRLIPRNFKKPYT